MTFDDAFLALFASARAIDNRMDVAEDLTQAEEDARAFIARLEEIRTKERQAAIDQAAEEKRAADKATADTLAEKAQAKATRKGKGLWR